MTVRGNEIIEKAYQQGWLDVGNWENVNAEMVIQLNEK